MHGYALEWLAPHLTPGKKVLDVGCGSGYLTACFAELVRGGGGHAFGIDHIDGLVKLSETNMQRGNPEFLERGEAWRRTEAGPRAGGRCGCCRFVRSRRCLCLCVGGSPSW